MADSNTKETWLQPELEVFGDVETLTLAGVKVVGSSDGFTFQGQPIKTSG